MNIFKMLCGVLTIVFLAVIIGSTEIVIASKWSCIQTYSKENYFNKKCTSEDNDELGIVIKFLDNKPKYLIVECKRQQLMNVSYFDMLEGLRLHQGYSVNFAELKSIEIETCELSVSLCEFLEKFNSNRVNNSVTIQSNVTQRKCSLENVVNIKDVTFSMTKMVKVKIDLFEGLINLDYIDLMNNTIKEIPGGVFDSLAKLAVLDLGGNDITHLDGDIFKNLSELKTLMLWGNPLKTLPERIFSGTRNLLVLNMFTCALETLDSGIFSSLTQLEDLGLHKNNFTILPEGLFKYTHSLLRLTLFDNSQPLTLPSGLLANMTNLHRVLLNDNKLSVVPGDLFKGSKSLMRRLGLERNELTILPVDLLSGMSSLETLDLSSNQLTSLPDGIFSSLTKLRELNLAYNRLETISAFTFAGLFKLEELSLQSNALNFIDAKAFPTDNCFIKTLDLSNNKLTFTDATVPFELVSPFSNCDKLDTILLRNNSIEHVFYDWKRFRKLSYLDLTNNHIQILKKEDFEFSSDEIILKLVNNKITYITMDMVDLKTVKKVILFLEGNPVRCDCSMYTFLRYIEQPNSLNLEIDAVNCTSPRELSGMILTEINSHHVTCGVEDDCPMGCGCHFRPYDGAFIVNCTGLELKHAPRSLPWNDTWIYTELHLEHNLIEILPNLSQPGYERVTKMYASHNNITRLHQDNLSAKLKVLDLTNNKLTNPDSRAAFAYLSEKKWTFENLSLDENKFHCDCDARDLLYFVHSHVGEIDDIKCVDGRRMRPLSTDDICSTPYDIIIALSLTLAFAGILLGLLAILYYRYKVNIKVWLYAKNLCLWFVTEEDLDTDKEYDAFICYSHKDGDFVENYLVPGLESGPQKFKLCLHIRDWVPGEWITTQIMRSVKTSRRTVIVLSPNFLESVWGLVEFRTAHEQTMTDGRARVIILIYGDLGSFDTLDPELRGYLSTNTYITWDDPWFWKKMHYALPHALQKPHNKKLVKAPITSEIFETVLKSENGGIPLKVNTYTPTNKDANYNVNGYVGMQTSSLEIKTSDEEEKENVLA